ncbi:hypothetical protein ABTY61_36485 [Kitasatospora sp. NPDC096128]|uniref:hypothetical protein n=1 Tax=Kitasatospora sp. NPDC096128 TaxID=3155547 RepID=UPI00331CEB6D
MSAAVMSVAAPVVMTAVAPAAVRASASGPVAAAGQAARELRLVEIGFVLFLAACATGALVLLGASGRTGRRRGGD